MFLLMLMTSEQDMCSSHSAAIEYIYDNYYGFIKHLLISHLPYCAFIDDIVHEVFLSLIKYNVNIDVNNEVALKAYLKVVCKNHAAEYAKKEQDATFVSWEQSDKYESFKRTPEQKVLADEEYSELLDIILSLNEKYKEVFYLRFLSGLSIKEISKTLGITETTVSVRIHRARREVKVKYEKLKKRF